jgi:hypothetical protein
MIGFYLKKTKLVVKKYDFVKKIKRCINKEMEFR